MRASEILRAEGEKQGQILQAEGRREAAFRDAEARERQAEAEAKATQMVSDAIAGGNTQAINYFVAQKYVEAVSLFATSPHSKTILFPVEATQLIGTLGGIGELARDALDRRSEEHTSELQSLMRISYAVFLLNKITTQHNVPLTLTL